MANLALVPDRLMPPPQAGARTLRIGDLAKATAKTQRALRLYEELGLLTPGDRTSGGFRLYGHEAIERVHWIGKLQELGFTLQEIQDLVAALCHERVPKAAMAQVRAQFMTKLDDVAVQIERLSQLQRELMSSLTYLEDCVDCAVDTSSSLVSGAACCASCTDHPHHHAGTPSLLDETRRTAASFSFSHRERP